MVGLGRVISTVEGVVMKEGIKILFVFLVLFVFVFPETVFSDYACTLCESFLGEDMGGGKVLFSYKVMMLAGYSGTCGEKQLAAFTAELAKSLYSGGNCTSFGCCEAANCGTTVMGIKCDAAWVEGKIGRQHDISGYSMVVGVIVGSEKESAETLFDTFDSTNDYPDYTSEGLVRTDGLKGYMFNVSQGESESVVNVAVNMWKRGGYAPEDLVTTLDGIGGGDGTAESVAEGVGDAIDEKFGTGLAAPWNSEIRNDGTPSGLAGGSGYVPGSGVNPTFGTVHSLTESFANFKATMQGTALFGLPSSFASGAPAIGGTAPIMNIDGGDTFGSHNVDFAFMSPWLVVLRGAIMLAFAFAALKIITLKGGGG